MNFLVLAFLRYVLISCLYRLFTHAVTWPGCPHQAPEKMRNLYLCSALILLAAKGGVSWNYMSPLSDTRETRAKV